MANIASLLVNIGVKVDGALKVEQKLKSIRKSAREMGHDGARSAKRFGRAFRVMGEALQPVVRKIRQSIRKLVKEMGGLKGIAKKGATALTGAALGVYMLVDSQTAAMDRTNKLSRALGIGVEELQRLQFAASQSGVEAEALSKAMRTFNKNLLDMAHGSGREAALALEELQLKLSDFEGLTRTQQIGLIGERLNGIEDSAKRAALAGAIFGQRAGPQLATMLAEGTAGIEALAAGAKGVFSQADADRATYFQDRLGEVKNQVAALVRGIAVDLLPTVQDLLLSFKAWLVENEGLIQQKIPEVMGSIADAGRGLYSVLETVTGVMKALGIDTSEAEVAMVALASAAAGSIHPLLALVPVVSKLGAELAKMAVIGGKAVGTIGETGAMVGAAVEREIALGELHAGIERAQAAIAASPWGGTGKRVIGAGAGGPARRRGGGGGGGGGRGRGRGGVSPLSALFQAPSELAADVLYRLGTGMPRRGATSDDLMAALLAGQRGLPLFENLQRLADRTPSTKDVKPQVAVDITINQSFHNQQRIVAPDPVEAGKKSADAIRQVLREETAKAGQAIAGNVLR